MASKIKPRLVTNKEFDMIIDKAKRREHVLQHAATIFGRSRALAWMAMELSSLGNSSPNLLLESENGYQRVITELARFDQEVPSLRT